MYGPISIRLQIGKSMRGFRRMFSSRVSRPSFYRYRRLRPVRRLFTRRFAPRRFSRFRIPKRDYQAFRRKPKAAVESDAVPGHDVPAESYNDWQVAYRANRARGQARNEAAFAADDLTRRV